MSELHEFYNGGDVAQAGTYGVQWLAQSFTTLQTYKVTSVKIKVLRLGSPGTVTLSIRATDGNGQPTGSDLCSGTLDGNLFNLTSSWQEFSLGAGATLTYNVKYAIVVRAINGDAGNNVQWRHDNTSPTYTGGNYEISGDSGATWTAYTNVDLMFEVWGEVGVANEANIYPTSPTMRVSSIIHRYNRGVYNIEIGFGDVIAESKISNVPDVGGKAYTPHQLDPDKEVGYIPPPSLLPPLLPPTPHQIDPDREVGYVPPPSFAPTPHQIDPDREVGPRPPPQPEGNWYLNEFGGWEWFGPGAPTKPPPDNR